MPALGLQQKPVISPLRCLEWLCLQGVCSGCGGVSSEGSESSREKVWSNFCKTVLTYQEDLGACRSGSSGPGRKGDFSNPATESWRKRRKLQKDEREPAQRKHLC
ncbi:hypothetical protein NDU88_004301 [Pleurodeles waltl]|uniref:Uncharacterized protein n=1 Tax=Pleurodeles waltl TaxID=8319 RepID=A0AAV7LKZ6_PLEWA|nr:hypothetical protein NDU88_004301 [Pleurodeles waltl]